MIESVLLAIGPVFGVVGVAWAMARVITVPERWSALLQRVAFDVLVPVLLFHTMAGAAVRDHFAPGLLLAYYLPTFGLYAGVFAIARWRGRPARRANVLGLGASYGNTVMLGIPLVLRSHGDEAATTLFAIVGVHAVVLFVVTSVIHELAAAELRWRSLLRDTAARLFVNPVLLGIMAGALVSVVGIELPAPLLQLTGAIGQVAPWVALTAIGLGLARYRLTGADGREDRADAVLLLVAKMLAHPLLVALACALSLGLHDVRTHVLVTLAALPTGINVYLFAVRFRAAEAVTAVAVLASTAFAAVSTSLVVLALAALSLPR